MRLRQCFFVPRILLGTNASLRERLFAKGLGLARWMLIGV